MYLLYLYTYYIYIIYMYVVRLCIIQYAHRIPLLELAPLPTLTRFFGRSLPSSSPIISSESTSPSKFALSLPLVSWSAATDSRRRAIAKSACLTLARACAYNACHAMAWKGMVWHCMIPESIRTFWYRGFTKNTQNGEFGKRGYIFQIQQPRLEACFSTSEQTTKPHK